ncbi:hypothetical protein BXZ70DRAFT_885104 [Cristinia sonorae]|uniref:JmjC domain-containing protein n=1 Tax=Cristinia sonorae TaxID=1940300 RepID=A0A8K0V095_9AGAR|nr:hypothetical protein BXZ70DRAFT_885104 [Cristinia sonorae]
MAVISPRGWSLDGLLHRGKNFIEVPRCRADDPNLLERIAAFEQNGIPLIIEGWHTLNSWPKELFTVDWLIEHLGKEEITVRDVNERSDYSITLGEFIARSRETAARYRKDGSQQGHLYNKDAHCPTEWEEWVQEQHLPEVLCPGSRHDMIGCLTEAEQVESLMCYLGIGGTFTPCHKDLCASSGQNLMCYTEDRGSSFWFMTESQVAPEAAQFFWDHVGKHLDWEEHTASIQDFANAPFTVYIAEQTLGDLVLVPPRSSHQVINSGGLTVKTSWSRMTVAGLETALYHELPLYRRVCRHEQYRVKHILYRAVSAKTEELKRYHQNKEVSHPTLTMTQLRELIRLFDVVLHEEYLQKHRDLRGTTRRTLGKKTSTSPSDEDVTASSARVVPNTQLSNLACDFCGADIFQSFFECTNCQDKKADVSDPMRVTVGNGLTLCPTCYVEGRTCNCGAMKTRQCRQFIQILRERNDAASVLNTVCPEQPAVICLDEK